MFQIILHSQRGKTMAKTLADIKALIEEEGIEFVDFKLTDISGRWRHLSIPAKRLTESTMEHGIGFDGSTTDMLLWRTAIWYSFRCWTRQS